MPESISGHPVAPYITLEQVILFWLPHLIRLGLTGTTLFKFLLDLPGLEAKDDSEADNDSVDKNPPNGVHDFVLVLTRRPKVAFDALARAVDTNAPVVAFTGTLLSDGPVEHRNISALMDLLVFAQVPFELEGAGAAHLAGRQVELFSFVAGLASTRE